MKETGAEYPTLELDGKSYVVKFTRATIYQLEKQGIPFAPHFTGGGASLKFTTLVDTLKLCLVDFQGTNDDLAELVYDVRDEAASVLIGAWGKVVLPSFKTRVAAKAAAKQSPTLAN